ncbi:hypothetical protein [Nonomuraea sp. NPDC050202]|jgi:hypothetical protein
MSARVVVAAVLAAAAAIGGLALAGSASADPMEHQSVPAATR